MTRLRLWLRSLVSRRRLEREMQEELAQRAHATKAEPGTPEFRKALHDAIAATRELTGTHGVFSFQPNEPYGLDKRSAVVIRLDKGQWKLVP